MNNERYSYLRQNGNYLVQLKGFRFGKEASGFEIFGENHFIVFWNSISIYIIDETIPNPYYFKN